MSANGNTALHIAVINNQLDRLREILKTPGCDCNKLNHRRETALFLSLKLNSSDELITTILDHGCDVNTPNRKGVTPLHLAAERNTEFITCRLLANGAHINAKDKKMGCTPLYRAIVNGRLANLQELLKWHDCPLDEIKNDHDQTPLLYGLCKKSSDKIISTLVAHSCDVNISDADGCTALQYAILRKSNYVARKLIEKGADVNVKDDTGSTPLHYWSTIGNIEGVCMLLYYNASVNEVDDDNVTPIFKCVAQSDNLDVVPYLLDYVVDFNEENNEGYTLLYMALDRDLDIALDIIEKGADVNKLSNGEHNLNIALVYHSSFDVLKLLWSKTDFELFKTLYPYHVRQSSVASFCCFSKLQNEEFLTFLYTILDSPYLADLLRNSEYPNDEEFIIDNIIYNREFSLNQRLEMISVLLSYGVKIFYHDILTLYRKYGFDECLELILMSGRCIDGNTSQCICESPIVQRICFDSVHMSIHHADELEDFVQTYFKFYAANLDYENDTFEHGISSDNEISSLLEICRNLIRKIVFQKWSTPYSFRVYEALSKLPVPSLIKDILFLKRPIYL